MGAPIHAPEMAGADTFTMRVLPGMGPARVREWCAGGGRTLYLPKRHGWVAHWRLPTGVQIVYAGSHPSGISRGLWREWVGTAHDLEFWSAARGELRVIEIDVPRADLKGTD